jgi:hypothetical protein
VTLNVTRSDVGAKKSTTFSFSEAQSILDRANAPEATGRPDVLLYTALYSTIQRMTTTPTDPLMKISSENRKSPLFQSKGSLRH